MGGVEAHAAAAAVDPLRPGVMARGAETDWIFAGPGEMRALCRDFDWAATPLGPVSEWSTSLRALVGLVLGSTTPMFVWWGPDLIQIYNDAYRPSFGKLGRHPRALGMRGRECWTDIWDTIGPQIEQVMTTGVPVWHEDLYLPIERNGTLEDVWWTYSYSPAYEDDGSIAGTVVTCLETTSRVMMVRERESLLAELEVERARLEQVFQRAPSFIVVLRGPELSYEFVNGAYYQLVGDRDILGKPLLQALPELADQPFVEILHEVLDRGEPWIGRAAPVQLHRTPGQPAETRYIDTVFQALVEADGTRSGVVAHGSDVTEHVLARREIERLFAESEAARAEAEAARAEAESANRAKGDFLAVMSHELRTPLNAIGGYAELMQLGIRGPLTAEQAEDLRRIQTSQRHLLGLINEVLNYARLETGTVHYELTAVPVQEALTVAESLVAPQARAKGIALTSGGCTPSLAVHADTEKLRQILVNLLSNAVKFTDRGGRIETAVDATGPLVSLRIRDTGIGIAADKLDTIFDPFVQVRSDLTRPHEGSGLGLAISRDLARGMGGDLVVESIAGQGSVFTVLLPARSPD